MLKKLTYKQKTKLLLLCAVISFFICYNLAISKTITEYQNYQQQLKQVSAMAGTNDNSLALQVSKLENLSRQYTVDSAVYDRGFLLALDAYCKEYNLTFKEYKPLPALKTTDNIWTRYVTVEGNFTDILKLVYEFEQKEKTGRITSVLFKSYMDNTNKKLKLACTFYIQNLLNKN